MSLRVVGLGLVGLLVCPAVVADPYVLLNGVDALHYPGTERLVVPQPGPGIPGAVYDGDRLAGTSDTSAETVPFYGVGTPMFEPNEFGSLSFLFRRGSVPAGPAGRLPLQGIEFLGGPLLDLDGDPDDATRSLVPVAGASAVVIPDTQSVIELEFDLEAGTVQLLRVDVTGNNEGGPDIQAEIATILVTLAGTENDGTPGAAINPLVDTRSGTLTAWTGTSGTLTGVYRIAGLGYELWEDTIDPASATADVLGTMQFLGSFDGWLVLRDATGQFPALSGEGLGSTSWPLVDTEFLGDSFLTAHELFGGSATITAGPGGDQFTAPGNGGLALTDFGGDLGGYFDAVVVPNVPAEYDRFVYLEAAGAGINNSSDPIYMDSVSYDAVFIAAGRGCANPPADANCDGVVNVFDIDPFVIALSQGQEAWEALPGSTCDFLCVNDVDGSGAVDAFDIDPFVERLTR